MIKNETDKNTKTQIFFKVIVEYTRTVLISFAIALFFTLGLSIHARSEMIKNLYANIEEKIKLDEQIAMQIVAQSDLTKDLANKKYSLCMQVANLYYTAHDYPNAQYAYEIALEKVPPGVYLPYQKLTGVLIAQEKFDEANKILNSITDIKNKNLIKFKTRSYIEMGDKYYSIGKFLSSAKSYEKAKFYYDRFSKKDAGIEKSINTRIVNAYIKTADVMAQSGYNSEAIRFLKKAEAFNPDDFKIKYKLALVYADLDPVQSVEYFEPLLKKMPQHINYEVYGKALMKAANISDLEGNPTKAKYYRYKIHSIDIFVNRKVVYKDDIETILEAFTVKKFFFKYKLRAKYKFKNTSSVDIRNLTADFILKQGDKAKESVTVRCVTKDKPLYSNGGETNDISIVFGKNIFTKKELEQYHIEIYVYKCDKYKTLVSSMKVPLKSLNTISEGVN